jgi:hypothetical protein
MYGEMNDGQAANIVDLIRDSGRSIRRIHPSTLTRGYFRLRVSAGSAVVRPGARRVQPFQGHGHVLGPDLVLGRDLTFRPCRGRHTPSPATSSRTGCGDCPSGRRASRPRVSAVPVRSRAGGPWACLRLVACGSGPRSPGSGSPSPVVVLTI